LQVFQIVFGEDRVPVRELWSTMIFWNDTVRFTDPSLVAGKDIQTIFIDGEDLILVLEEHLTFRKMIDQKVKAAQTKGLIYVHPISGKEKI